jgi:hypothetical protein
MIYNFLRGAELKRLNIYLISLLLLKNYNKIYTWDSIKYPIISSFIVDILNVGDMWVVYGSIWILINKRVCVEKWAKETSTGSFVLFC